MNIEQKSQEQEQEQQTRRGVAVYTENPFFYEVSTRTRRVSNRRGDMMLVNSSTGEIQSQIAGFWESEEVDSTQFVKLFVNGVKALKELTSSGTKVFEILYLEVQKNIGQDKVFLSYGLIKQEITPMSKATYSRGLSELIEKKFLAATEIQGFFWLNPDFVWNGDRLAFVKEFRKRKEADYNALKDTKTIDFIAEAEKH